ncbi:serine/arginine repetitive matrix protein 1-like [Camelus ferus]|uniref:Serine/arginine repetitive matrix protein 1-like n=1 Tax=Camelus ferus TaxID=419612 RepID=A0A8B8U7H4_CAMFR|nr:serine/arginine repetitive matrix protein 1-like [Camelus ferus]
MTPSALRRARGTRLRGPVRSRRGPARRHSWMEPGQEPGRGACPRSPPPAAPGEPTAPARPRPPHGPPTPLTRLEPATSEGPGCARGGCARPAPGCGKGSERSGRRRRRRHSSRHEPSGRRRRLQQQVSIKVLVRSLFPHSGRAQRRLQLFQNTRPVPPTPRLRRSARRGVESRGGRRTRGAVAANFPPDLPVALGRLGVPELPPPLGSASSPGGVRGKEAASPAGSERSWNGMHKEAAAASPFPQPVCAGPTSQPLYRSRFLRSRTTTFIQTVDSWPTSRLLLRAEDSRRETASSVCCSRLLGSA